MDKILRGALTEIPLPALAEGAVVRLPDRPLLEDDSDLEPLHFQGSTSRDAPLPSWIRVDPDAGTLTLADVSGVPQCFRVDIYGPHGCIGAVACTFCSEWQPLNNVTEMLATSLEEERALDEGTRTALKEQLAQVYDFTHKTVQKEKWVAWLHVMQRLWYMLRGTTRGALTAGSAHAALRRANS